MNPLLTVMISSTIRDLGPERDAVDSAIRHFRFQRFRAESLGSRARSSSVVCDEMAASCDLFILILGARYGAPLASTGISVTEREYDVAHRHDPSKILVYVKDVPEREPQQEAFLRKVAHYKSGYFHRKPFARPDELREAVVQDMAAWVSERAHFSNRHSLMNATAPLPNMHTWDFSPYPFNTSRVENLPVLSRRTALLWYLGAAVGSLPGAVAAACALDPWTSSVIRSGLQEPANVLSLALAVLACAIMTFMIGKKQWLYYFDESGYTGAKEGIFERSIRQASPLEVTTDTALCVLAGLLTAIALTAPILWFAALSIYSLMVVARSALTLRRADIWRRDLGDAEAFSWMRDSLLDDHNGLEVGRVLRSWRTSHGVLTAASVAAFALLSWVAREYDTRILLLLAVTAMAFCAALHRLLSKVCYERAPTGRATP